MRLAHYLQSVGKNIRQARINAGLRQVDVNDKIGLSHRHYQNIEAGKINLTVATLCRLAKLFKASIKDLVDECE